MLGESTDEDKVRRTLDSVSAKEDYKLSGRHERAGIRTGVLEILATTAALGREAAGTFYDDDMPDQLERIFRVSTRLQKIAGDGSQIAAGRTALDNTYKARAIVRQNAYAAATAQAPVE